MTLLRQRISIPRRSTMCRKSASRFITAALGLVVMAMMPACNMTPPSPEELAKEDKASRANQVVRVADTTRQGGDLKSAISLYRRAADMRPDWPVPLIAIGETAGELGAFSVAIDAYRKAIELDGANSRSRRGYGKALIALNHPEQAAAQFEAAIRLEPKDYRAYNALGVALDLLGKHEKAQQLYIDGIEIAPDKSSLQNNLALSLALAGDFGEAIRILQEIVSDPMASAQHRQNLALVYGLAGRTKEARALGLADLRAEEVESNLVRYEALRALSAQARAQAIFGFHAAGVPLPSNPVSKAPVNKN